VPVLVFSPAVTTLDFGSVSAGSVSAPQTVTVLNQGPGGATLTLLNAVGGDASSFSVVGGTCAIGTVLFEAATCTISVQFAPGSAGTKTAQVQIASTGSFPPVLTLTGVGLAGPNPSLGLSTAALAFETTKVGSQSLPSMVRLSSSGSGVVTGQRDRRERHLWHRQHHLPGGALHAAGRHRLHRVDQLPADRRRQLRRHAQHHQRRRPGGARGGAQRQRRGQGRHQQRRLQHRRLGRPGRSAAVDDGPDRRGVALRQAPAARAGFAQDDNKRGAPQLIRRLGFAALLLFLSFAARAQLDYAAFGTLDLSYGRFETSGADPRHRWNSNSLSASFVGAKASYGFDNGVTVGANLETFIRFEDLDYGRNEQDPFLSRNNFVSLQHNDYGLLASAGCRRRCSRPRPASTPSATRPVSRPPCGRSS
jgi:hypothetical protein